MIMADFNSEEGNMESNLPNFPLLFEKISAFFILFNKLREARLKSPAEFAAEFDKLVKPSSPSSADEAFAAWETIVDTVYYDRAARECVGGSTKMRG